VSAPGESPPAFGEGLHLLTTTKMKVEAIAAEIGFASVAHFATWFRRRRGLTPAALREELDRPG
jgi:transcriptional regulator GlxA family with amidase domain